MIRVLLCSIAFPPKRDAESLQVAKYCKFLREENNFSLQVITSTDPTLFMEPDDSLLHYGKGINVVKRIKIFENRYVNYLIRKINPEWLQFPDSKFTFWWQSKKVIEAVKKKPDILYSRSYPLSSTLMALKLKKKWGIPWLLHLSDPWAQSSVDYASPATTFLGKTRAWNEAQEKECFALADKISFTSQKTIALYTKAYPQLADKFVYYPNVFDDDFYIHNPYVSSSKLKFVYTGGFGEARSPDPLLKAIQWLWNHHKQSVDGSIEFLFTGEMTRKNHVIFNQYASIPWINHLGVIPYNQVITLQRSASVLVNIDSNIPDPSQSVFFPSKLLDYLLAQRRILAITNSHSVTHQVIQDGKLGDCFDFNESSEQIANYMLDALKKHKQGDETFFYRSDIKNEFSARHNANRLLKLFLLLHAS